MVKPNWRRFSRDHRDKTPMNTVQTMLQIVTLISVIAGAGAMWAKYQSDLSYLETRVTASEVKAERDHDLMMTMDANIKWLMFRAGGTPPSRVTP